MKILIATDAWHPQISGVVRTTENLCSELRKLGHSVYIITPDLFFNFPTPGYKEIPISIPFGLDSKIRKINPDAIHIITEGSIGFAVKSFCIKNNLPFTTSYTTHFAELIEKKYKINSKWGWKYLRNFHKDSKHVIVSSNALVDELKTQGIENTTVIQKGIDFNEFNSRYRNNDFAIEIERPIWLYVGRVSIEKNLEQFFNLSLPGTKVCIGRGPELKYYRKKYQDVCFLGVKTGIDLASWYANSDVFVFPSLWDTLGMVMLESKACGTPVAAFPVRGPLQVIKHGISGILNSNLQTACFKALELNRNKVEESVQEYSWANFAKEFLKIKGEK